MTILTAVDGERIPSRPVEIGYELARQFDEELVVLHVMPQDVFDGFRDSTTDGTGASFSIPGIAYGGDAQSGAASGGQHQYSIEDGDEDAAALARDVVDETLDDRRNVTFLGRVGDPATEIVNEADRMEPRYLVIGGRKRSPVGKAMFGSINQSVLLEASLPVVTVMHQE
ncbi:MAG: universal stress protein [Haloarculaceae archaeon]